MFNLEKLFQKDDEIFVFFSFLSQSLIVFFALYLSTILSENTLLDLFNFGYFVNSQYFYFVTGVFVIFLSSYLFIRNRKNYVKTYYYYITRDIKNFSLIYFILFALSLFLYGQKVSFIWFLNTYIFVLINLFLIKFINNQIYRYLIINNVIQRNILIISNFETVKKFIEIYKNKKKKSLIKCCIITDLEEGNFFSDLKIPNFYFNDNIYEILNYHHVGQIWLQIENEKQVSKLEKLLKFPFDIKLFSKFTNQENINYYIKKFNIMSTIEKKNNYIFYSINNSRFTGIPLFFKFLIDKFFSILILLLTFPILLAALLLIFIEDGFPVFFKQKRTGWDGRRFNIFKLRTLKKKNFDKTIQVQSGDKRLLFFGKFLRRFSIDELPQIYNVLKGEMSIVGPRPHMTEHSKKYSNIIKNFLTRHKCSPGITGWAQIHGYRGATLDDELMKKRLDYDIWYLKNWSIALDFKIMFRTIYAILKYRVD